MDYLVFGVGFGSTLVLVGWILRQYGPLLRFRDSGDDVLSAEQLLERNDWQRFCVALGALLSVGGAVMLLATLVTMLIHPSDDVGTMIVGIIFALSLIAVAGWIVMYVNQHRALADDRRMEAVKQSQARRTASPRKPAAAESKTDEGPATAPNSSSAPTQPDQARRPAVQQRLAASEGTPSPAPTRSPSQTTTTTAAPPATRQQRPQEAQRPASEPRPSSAPVQQERTAAPTPGAPAGSPTPTLRNLQFKRTTANRAQQERRPAPSTGRTVGGEPDADTRN